ncbi:unnamed protein product [[Candida] boidinii]|uniref:Unnamed protein product n=1 Tax=Candida boidinii TaxID=5477 RepID=A0A9W6WD35_CANBO|nr:unnamed protein product [[Candida] boidinii]
MNEHTSLITRRVVKIRKTRSCCSILLRFFLISTVGLTLLLIIPLIYDLSSIYKNYENLINRLPKDEIFNNYLNVLENSNYARNWSYEYTKEPHLAGTNYELVKFTQDKFKEYGLETSIKEYFVYLNFPKDNSLKLINTNNDTLIYEPSLIEDQLIEDPTTRGDDLIASFHGYSANGNVTAEYVYVNYGTMEDFELLKSNGVDVSGKIVIARYGKIYRGLKVKFAQENGAVGCLIYSDPGDDYNITEKDGFKTYPDGPARNPSAIQRGSVLFLSYAPGDPTTPGYPSLENSERQDPQDALPKIPSLPISYKEIEPILSELIGYGLNTKKISSDFASDYLFDDYFTGPKPGITLNLYNEQLYNITPIWNVMGELKGIMEDEVIIIGNHRDAWIKGGAGDPNSGSAVILEIIRSLNELVKLGWKPLRTILFASWDGEEIGLLGSTEFVEEYSKILSRKVVAYLNLDVAVAGTQLEIGSSPLLDDLLIECSKLINYPSKKKKTTSIDDTEKNITLYEHFGDKDKISVLGSGSDYTAFLEHIGIPSVDLGFVPNGIDDPIYHYHSNYDSFHWMEKFVDPNFEYHNTISKYLGLVILKLSEVETIQFNITNYISKIDEYYKQIQIDLPVEFINQSSLIFNNNTQTDTFLKDMFNYFKNNKSNPINNGKLSNNLILNKFSSVYNYCTNVMITYGKIIYKFIADVVNKINSLGDDDDDTHPYPVHGRYLSGDKKNKLSYSSDTDEEIKFFAFNHEEGIDGDSLVSINDNRHNRHNRNNRHRHHDNRNNDDDDDGDEEKKKMKSPCYPFDSCNFTVNDVVTYTNKTITSLINTSRKYQDKIDLLQKDIENLNLYSISSMQQNGVKLTKKDILKLLLKLKWNNSKLKLIERLFIITDPNDGLNNRTWFKHLIYASGRYTGYEGQTLPGIRESIEDKNVNDFIKFNTKFLISLHEIEQTLKFF